MNGFPTALYGARELAELDRRADGRGLPGDLLMERAGKAAFAAIRARWPDARRWRVYAGGGNNGGDGYVVARLARKSGFEVALIALKPPREDSPAATAASAYREAGGEIVAPKKTAAHEADLMVDALFGIGLSRAPEGAFAEAIEAMNAAPAPTVAMDIPSGLIADTGATPGPAVRAALTVTFIGLKPGLFTGAGSSITGELVFASLDVPEEVADGLPVRAQRVTQAEVARGLPPRVHAAHKGLYGHVLVVGGDHGTGGAVRLAGEAAQRVGAGLVSVVTRPEHVAPLLAARPELMVHACPDGNLPGALSERSTVLALGPGLGQGEWGKRLWEAALALDKPVVVDADALNLLAQSPRKRGNWILTPHPGEAARLLDTTVAEIEKDRFAALEKLVSRYDAVVVLKGAGTLVGAPGAEPPWLCDRGNPGMASGGMGDALTGAIAGLLAQRLAATVAARLGVWLHAAAGDRAAAAGERGLLAGDLVAELRATANP
ncbi:MAG: NAD(P)H-hydrate dehydratase [Gammaproteobacteria bacterium]